MWYLMGLVLALALGVIGCSETAGTGGAQSDGGPGGDGGTDLCYGIICEDDGKPCTRNGVCDPADGMCNYAPVEDGTACGDGPGACEAGVCVGGVFACTEQGIRDAIAVGGGPHTFACQGPTTVMTEAELVIDNDVALDGRGNLIVDGRRAHSPVFSVPSGIVAVLRGLTVLSGGIANAGTLTIEDCLAAYFYDGSTATIVNEEGATLAVIRSQVGTGEVATGTGIDNQATARLTVESSTIAGYQFPCSPDCTGTGLHNEGDATVVNSTLSWNAIGISNHGALFLVSSSVPEALTALHNAGTAAIASSILNSCSSESSPPVSNGYNIESYGNSCGFSRATDQVNVSADDLKLGELADNGGPTMTHGLGPGSVAIDVIPEAECIGADGAPLTTDQRGAHRPVGDACDVGAFELGCLTDEDCNDGIACTWDVCNSGTCDYLTLFCPWCELPLSDYCSGDDCPTWDEALADAIEACENAEPWELVSVTSGDCDGFRYLTVGGGYGGSTQYFDSSGAMVSLISCTDCNCLPCPGGPDAFCINYGLVIDCPSDPDRIVHCQHEP